MQTRNSSGLLQFCSLLEDRPGQNILDFAGASQATITYLTNHYHRLYSLDLVHQLDESFGAKDFYQNQTDPVMAADFLNQAFSFPDQQFDAVLIWDALQFLSSPLLENVMQRLARVVRPGGSLLAVFHAEEHANNIPIYSYRIVDQKTIGLVPKGMRKPAKIFNNRGLEKLFQDFESVKFFLTRDSLREVIVRR
ncbi:MAG: class I SAM-dependent methyltransferase [Acidobacteriota bacterium]